MIIIPDIHGRDFWKKPVYENLGKEHIIFLGDYMDPYEDEQIAPWEVFPQLEEIVKLKEKNSDNVTLLLGNHDIHYLTEKGRGGRYDYIRGAQIKHFLIEHADSFQLALSSEVGGKNLRDLRTEQLRRLWEFIPMPGELAGTTPVWILTKRGAIEHWIKQHPDDRYVILDDADLGFENQIRTDPHTGLVVEDAEKAIGLLNK